jgi:hypothetical protein
MKTRAQGDSLMSDTLPRDQKEVFFEYVGKTGMTVIGPISGVRYRFIGPGSILSVDPRDRRALVNVPNLRHAPGKRGQR